jgi:hypothetical protein
VPTAEKSIARLKLLAVLFEAMGNLISTIGKQEEETQQENFFSEFTTDALATITGFSETLNAEELGKLMQLLLKLTTHTSTLGKLFELTPKQKIDVGNELTKLSNETNSLVDNVKKRTRNG